MCQEDSGEMDQLQILAVGTKVFAPCPQDWEQAHIYSKTTELRPEVRTYSFLLAPGEKKISKEICMLQDQCQGFDEL